MLFLITPKPELHGVRSSSNKLLNKVLPWNSCQGHLGSVTSTLSFLDRFMSPQPVMGVGLRVSH